MQVTTPNRFSAAVMVLCVFLIFSCLNFVISDDSIVYPCLTPNDDIGICISLFDCPVLQKTLGTSSPSAIKFIKESVCNICAFKDLRVCCGKLGDFSKEDTLTSTKPNLTSTNFTDKQAHRDFVIKKLLPTITYCGLQHTDDRFYNESETALDEFPWLVHVIFGDEESDGDDDPLEFADRCNGVLINRRYVLTNRYCARNPKKVRLGQYNTNKTVSCVENPDFPECTEPTTEVRIEEQIHMVGEEFGWYEFALFRLSKNVTYTDFIRPICLPLHDRRTSVKHEELIFSGWGAADQKGVMKKRLTYKATNVEECYNASYEDAKELSANVTLICLAPQEGASDLACSGDTGSPLMYKYNFQWFADAIITDVYTEPREDCSNKKPIDAIRITPEVIEWILQTIRA